MNDIQKTEINNGFMTQNLNGDLTYIVNYNINENEEKIKKIKEESSSKSDLSKLVKKIEKMKKVDKLIMKIDSSLPGNKNKENIVKAAIATEDKKFFYQILQELNLELQIINKLKKYVLVFININTKEIEFEIENKNIFKLIKKNLF